MKSLLCTLLIGISGLFSCVGSSDSEYPRYTVFPEEKDVTAQELPLDTVLLRYPFRVAVRSGVAIVMDLHATDHFFHAFHYPEWEYIVSFGDRGEGPDEMLSALQVQFNSLDSIWALDANKMQISRWSISPDSRSAERQEIITLDNSLVRSLDFYAMDSCLLIPGYMGDCRYWEVGYDGKPIKSIGEIPTELYKMDDMKPALAQGWRSFMDYNPKNGVLTFVTQLGEAIEIYNLKENTHYVAYGPNGEPKFKRDKEGGGTPVGDGIMGFGDVVVTEQYIYAPFWGVSFKDKIKVLKEGKKTEEGGRYIYVFDLKGNPVRKYTLDKAICGITVDEETNTIIGTCAESDEPIIKIRI